MICIGMCFMVFVDFVCGVVEGGKVVVVVMKGWVEVESWLVFVLQFDEGEGVVVNCGGCLVVIFIVDGVMCVVSVVCIYFGGVFDWNDVECMWDCLLYVFCFVVDGIRIEGFVFCDLDEIFCVVEG